MKLRFIIALWAAKLVRIAARLTGHNATNIPGEIANKICPEFLKYIKKPDLVIGVTGTNGKTTVTNLIDDVLKNDGHKVLSNSSGSNVNDGIASALCLGVNIFNKRRDYDIAVLEIDERSAIRVYPYVKVDYLIITNLTRDSIMRNAHPQYIADFLTTYLKDNTKLILNADDLIASSVKAGNERVYFGIDKMDSDITECINRINDMQICPNCYTKLKYEYLRYHHIGKAYCPKCGFKSPEYDYRGYDVDLVKKEMKIADKTGSYNFKLISDSIFNAYNLMALVSLLRELGYSFGRIGELCSDLQIVASRYNVEEYKGHKTVFQMAKEINALACSRVFDYLRSVPGKKEVLFMSFKVYQGDKWSENVSWLYDADFEFLNDENISKVVVYSPVALDLRLRLLMAGLPEDKIAYSFDLNEAVNQLNLDGDVYILYGSELGNLKLAKDARALINKRLEEL